MLLLLLLILLLSSFTHQFTWLSYTVHFHRITHNILYIRKKKEEGEGDINKPRKWHQKKDKDGSNNEPKYRDRAKERREDANPDYDGTDPAIAGFHSVPPPSGPGYDG